VAIRRGIKTVLSAKSLLGRFVHGAFWSVIGAGCWQGAVLAASVVVARLLGPEALGEFGMVQSTVGMFGVFAGMGLGLTATRFIAEFRDKDPGRAGRVVGLTLLASVGCAGLISGVLAVAAPALCEGPMGAAHLVTTLRVGSLLLLFNTVAGVQTGALAGLEAFSAVAWTNFVRGGVTLGAVITATHLWGVFGAITGLAVGAFVGSTVAHFTLRRIALNNGMRIVYRGLRPELPLLWKLSIPAFLSGAAMYPVNWAVRAIVANQPGGYAALGVFTGAIRFQEVITYAGQTVGAALLPMLASVEKAKSGGLILGNHLFPWVMGSVATAPLICFPEVMGWLLGTGFDTEAAHQALVLVLLSTCIMMYKQGLAREVVVGDYMWWGALSNFSTALIVLTTATVLRRWGAPGLALAYLVGQVVNAIIFVPFYVRRGLAPKELLMSREGVAIWTTFAVLSAVSLAGAVPSARVAAMAVAAFVVGAACFRMGRRQLSHSAS
jgi:O-antigen/teichoic acid export membrane protein